MILAIIILVLAVLSLSVVLLITIKSAGAEHRRLTADFNTERQQLTADFNTERQKLNSDFNTERNLLNQKIQSEMAEKNRLQERLDILENEKENHEQENTRRFNLLAREILDDNSKKFKEQSEQRIADLLNPLREELDKFQRSVNDAYSNEARERFALSERIKELVQLNETIGREAKDLTRALRGDSKIQGDWGEMILETLLERSGLKKGIHFDLQVTTDSDGNVLKDNQGHMLRPDAVINFPDGRCVIVDSKVSLTSYIDLINSETGTPQYNDAAQGHLRSVKSHIKELATKNYQDFIGEKKADFVAMFIPNEGAYMAAMNLDTKLWQEAYDQRVLIVSPTHLLSFVRLSEQMWRQEDMKRNVMDIAEESGKMYDKFVGFVEDMARIEKGIASVESAYQDAMGKLTEGRGNLVRRAEKIKAMGAKTSKTLTLKSKDNDL